MLSLPVIIVEFILGLLVEFGINLEEKFGTQSVLILVVVLVALLLLSCCCLGGGFFLLIALLELASVG